MADNNFEELNESAAETIQRFIELARQGKLTTDELLKFQGQIKKQGPTMKDFGKATATAIGGVTGFATSLAGGNTSLAAMQGALTAVGDAAGSLAASFPFVGGLFSAAIKGMVAVTNIGVDRLQASHESFQKLADAGLIGAAGITGMRDQFIQAKIPLAEFAGLMAANSKSMAYLEGSAMQGASALTNVLDVFQNGSQNQLRYLGFSIEDMATTVVDFQKMNQRLGLEQITNTRELAKASTVYGEELDLMTKLTGRSRKEIEADRDKLLRDDRFRAFLDGIPQGADVKTAMMDVINDIGLVSPVISDGIKDLFASGGAATTDAANRVLQQGLGPVVAEAREGLISGRLKRNEARNLIFAAADKTKGTFREISRFMGDFGAAIPYAQLADLAEKGQLTTEKFLELVAAQKKQTSGTDQLTTDLTNADRSIKASASRLDELALSTGFAQTMVKNFASTMDQLTDFLLNDLLASGATQVRSEGKELSVQTELRKDKSGELKAVVTQEEYAKVKNDLAVLSNQLDAQRTKAGGVALVGEALKENERLNAEWRAASLKMIFAEQNRERTSVRDVVKEFMSDEKKNAIGIEQGITDFVELLGFDDIGKGNYATPEQANALRAAIQKQIAAGNAGFWTEKESDAAWFSESVTAPKLVNGWNDKATSTTRATPDPLITEKDATTQSKKPPLGTVVDMSSPMAAGGQSAVELNTNRSANLQEETNRLLRAWLHKRTE